MTTMDTVGRGGSIVDAPEVDACTSTSARTDPAPP